MLPLWIAEEEGHLRRRGLEVEMVWLQHQLEVTAKFPDKDAYDAEMLNGQSSMAAWAIAISGEKD
jgi:hypothetical protein